MDKTLFIKQQIIDHKNLVEKLEEQLTSIQTVAELVTQAFKNGNKVILMGNGGSAADAQHLAAELVGKFQRNRDPLPAIALSVNTSVLTAIGNDMGYEYIFSRQIKGFIKPGDIVVGISTSGNSKNIILALEEAKKHHAITVGLTGHGGKLKEIADYSIAVPSRDTPRIQEAHILIGHIICSLVEDEIFGKENGA